MYNLRAFLGALERFAPLELSKKMIQQGEYDNSGVIINCHDKVEKALFALDLSRESVKKAVQNKCDTIVTHHPAIYYPVKNLDVNSPATAPLLTAAKHNINVISMHLNLDGAENGIDDALCKGLGGEKYKMLFAIDEKHGYGREFSVNKKLSELVKEIKKNFNTNKLTVYGKPSSVIKKAASFCGGGASHAEKSVLSGLTDADLIITSDAPHHVIKELVEANVSIILLPHYVAEEYGFKSFYERVTESVTGWVSTVYFDDKRFR